MTILGGITAYFVRNCQKSTSMLLIVACQGLLDIGKIKAGETLVVSGAAGSVGLIACQIGN